MADRGELQRTELLLGGAALERLRRCTVLVAGLGGTGGGLAVTLARLGVGRLIIADPGRFDWPDLNRQWAADAQSVGRGKAEVYEELLRRVSPALAVESHPEGVRPENVQELVEHVDLVCDNLDIAVEMSLRARMLALARERGIYATSCPIIGFGAFVAVASPDGPGMEAFLQRLGQVLTEQRWPEALRRVYTPEHLDRIAECLRLRQPVPSLAIATLVSAAACSTEALLILLRGVLQPWREPLALPRVLMIDLFRMSYQVLDVEEL
jgi:molybdopterin/thiamine biosynthesis adenylyltransferase